MATEFEHPGRPVERPYVKESGVSIGAIVGTLAVLAVAAFIFISFYNVNSTAPPPKSSVPTSTQTGPKTTAPPATTATPPSTK